MPKPINTTKIELIDLNNYRDNLPTDSTSPSITNFLVLKSELKTEGLNALNNALNSGVGIDEIRKEYSHKLLQDVESLTKRADFQIAASRNNIPKFKQEFYQELKKPANERSEEYKNFMTSCSNLMLNIDDRNPLTCTELISVRMLNLLDQKEIQIHSLKTKLADDIKEYKTKSTKQTIKDIGVVKTVGDHQELEVGREEIFFKDKQGNTKILNKENFAEESSLTGEQQDFIFSMWNQGTFGTGWFMDAGEKFQDQLMNNGGMVDLNGDKDFLMIDTSEDGKVKIRSRLAANIITDLQKQNEKTSYAQGVLEVDISNMKGDKFVPGCSTAEPKINFYISEFSNDYKYEIPEGLKTTQSLEYDNIRKQMIEDKKQACIDEIIKDGLSSAKALNSLSEITGLDTNTIKEFKENKILEGLKEITISEMQNLPQEAKIETLAVKCYKKIEQDPEKLLSFAKFELEKYCDKQDIKHLDSKETERIKNGIVSILDPTIDDPKEKKHLNKNIESVIRHCIHKENTSMSIKQTLKRIIDVIFKSKEIKNTIDKLQGVTKIAQEPNKRTFAESIKQERDSPKTTLQK